MPGRKECEGTHRKLVIAIDIGTTYSGVSYAFLSPGQAPEIRPVTQFLGQREPSGNSKVPSIVCYDQNGTVVAVGAETDPETNPALAKVGNVIKVEWFKLLLRPPHFSPGQDFEMKKLQSLPKHKKPVQVIGDLMRYLFQSTKQYITNPERWAWDTVEGNIHFVFSHPNGWQGREQFGMRRAAIAGGLVDNESEALSRITFVTEGEASLHFCLDRLPNAINNHTGDGILVVDCGGGTIDLSAYTRTNGSFKEIAPAECLFQGSIFITCRAQEYFRRTLRNSRYGTEHEIEAMTSTFDRVTKCIYDDPKIAYYVKFGGLRDHDPDSNIRTGNIKVHGVRIAAFFEQTVQKIVEAIKNQCAQSTEPIKTIFLVGGLARSNYLFSKLEASLDINILRADTMHLNKAVADGSVSYYLDHYVSMRVSKFTYGIGTCPIFDPRDLDHISCHRRKYLSLSGEYRIPGAFATILKKSTSVSEETEFRRPFMFEWSPEEFRSNTIATAELKCYRGPAKEPPSWLDMAPGQFHNVCTIFANIKNAQQRLVPCYNLNTQKQYYVFNFDIILLFGLTELKAQIAWQENVGDWSHHMIAQTYAKGNQGIEKRGPALIAYH